MNLQTKLVLLIGATVACATLAGVIAFDAIVGDEAERELWTRADAVAQTTAKNVYISLSEILRERDERKQVVDSLEERPFIERTTIFGPDLVRDPYSLSSRSPSEVLPWELENAQRARDTMEMAVVLPEHTVFMPVTLETGAFGGVVEIILTGDEYDHKAVVTLLQDFIPAAVASSLSASEIVNEGLGRLSKDLAQIDGVMWVEVFDADGKVIAHTDSSRVGKPPLPEHAAIVTRVLHDGAPVRADDIERARLNLFVPVLDANYKPVAAVEVVMDRSGIQAARASTRRILVIGGILILFALAGAIALGSQRLIVDRLRRILDGMDRFARHESDFEVPVNGEDELSILTQSFNHLLQTVNHTTVSREQAEAIFNAVPDALFVTTHDGVILEANHAAEQLTGTALYQLLGKRLGAFLTTRAPEEDSAEEATALARGELYSKGGAVDVMVSRTAIGGEHNEGRTVWSAQLLTARQQADEALAKARQAVERRQRLESLGRLAGGVAHDFNNLLTVILTATAILEERAEDGTFDDELVAITDAARRGAKLTQQLLVLGRRKPRREKTCQLDEVVGRLLPLLQRLLDRRVEFTTELGADDAIALISPDELEQVVLNLVLNARDACGDDGKIKLTTSVASDGGREEVVIAVADNGEGMDEATAGQIFDPFFTTKRAGKGTGLGLSTVHGIITRSDGDIEVTSVPGRGTTFTVRLPRGGLAENDGPTVVSHRTPSSDSAAGAVVLLVEDEDTVRRATARALKSFGYKVVAAENAERALELAASTDFDVVLSDVIMPGMKGTELANRIYQTYPGKPVVLMSGYTGDLVDNEALSKSSGFVSKPFKPEDLAIAVGAAVSLAAEAV